MEPPNALRRVDFVKLIKVILNAERHTGLSKRVDIQ